MATMKMSRTNLKKPITVDLSPVASEVISAKEFLELAKRHPTSIKSSRVVGPTPGKSGFGSFFVEYTNPILKATGG